MMVRATRLRRNQLIAAYLPGGDPPIGWVRGRVYASPGGAVAALSLLLPSRLVSIRHPSMDGGQSGQSGFGRRPQGLWLLPSRAKSTWAYRGSRPQMCSSLADYCRPGPAPAGSTSAASPEFRDPSTFTVSPVCCGERVLYHPYRQETAAIGGRSRGPSCTGSSTCGAGPRRCQCVAMRAAQGRCGFPGSYLLTCLMVHVTLKDQCMPERPARQI
jgi:hypothetical protein